MRAARLSCGMLNLKPGCARYRSTPHYRSRSLKMKSARFEKPSQEIGVPRGKKSERYRSTAHGQTDRHDLFRFRASVYPW